MKMYKDIAINFLVTVIISFLTFIVNRYFAIYIGAQNLGLMKLFTQILAYLNLAEIGLGSASTFALYKPLNEKNYEKISIIINTIMVLYNKIFFFILVVGLILNPIIPFFIKDEVPGKEIYIYWSLYVMSTALSYCFIKYNVLFTADQKFYFVRIVQGCSRAFCQILQIIAIVKMQSFFAFIVCLIFDNLIQYVIFRNYYKKYYKYVIKTKQRDNSIIRNLKNLIWHRIGTLVVFNTDLILISKFISLEIVGIYASYQMIVQMITVIINIVLNVLRPKIGKFIAENDKEEVFDYWKNLDILFLFISLFFSYCTYMLINSFISLWMGENFRLPNFTLILIIINLFIQNFRGIIDVFKEGSGFFDDVHMPISEAVINFVTSFVLVKYIGLNGVIIGTVVSNILIICIARSILIFKKCFDKTVKEYIKIYGMYLILIILSMLSCNFIFKFITLREITSWLEWIKQGIIIGTISFIVLGIIFLGNKNFRISIKKLF